MSHPDYAHIGSPVTRLIEECAELQLALCKAERFGWFNHHPDKPGTSNLTDVKREMDDVVECIEKVLILMRDMTHRFYNPPSP